MLTKNEKNAMLQNVVNELREQNKTISPAILRKTVYHVAKMGSADHESEHEIVYPPLLYAEAQAYMDGFSAALDGDYDIESVEINPLIGESIEQNQQLSQFGNILPSYMLSRASNYSAVVLKSQPEYIGITFGESIPTVSTTGFILGFSQAIKDLDQGIRYKSVNRLHSDDYYEKIADISVSSMILSGEQLSLKKLVSTFMKDISERKIATKSGRSRFNPEDEESCLTVYGMGIVQGIMAAYKQLNIDSKVDIPDSLRFVDAELESWCRINRYDLSVYENAKKASLDMLEQIDTEYEQDGMFLLNGWGFADGYASMLEAL